MELITHRITLDVNKGGVQRVIQGIETGDEYVREIRVSLANGKDTYELPLDSISASMYVMTPSSASPSINACTIDGNDIVYTILPSDISEAGRVSMQLKVFGTLRGGADKVLVSPRFALEVWESDVKDSQAIASPVYTALETALAQAKTAYDMSIESVIIDDDDMFVVTYRDGHTYESTVIKDALAKIADIETYVERAESASNIAVGARDSALLSLEGAQGAEHNAKTSEENAQASANIAQTVEGNVLQYREDARTYAENAQIATENALTYKNEAESSKNAAVIAKGQAETAKADAYTYKEEAKASKDSAQTSATNASASETNAHTYSTEAKSYAVGGTGTRPGEDDDNAKHYKEVCEQIAGGLEGGFLPMGTITFESLATISPNAGWMYNISNDFVSDSRFKDGGGKHYAAGTNVYYTADGMWDCMSGAIPKVNGKTGSSITLDGGDLLVTGYEKATEASPIADSDTINEALGKLEAQVENATPSDYDEVKAQVQSNATNINGLDTRLGTAEGKVEALEENVSTLSETKADSTEVENKLDAEVFNEYKAIITKTLSAGVTEVSFTSEKINIDTIFSFYTSVYGVNPTSVSVNGNTVTLGFKAQDTDIQVGVKIDG